MSRVTLSKTPDGRRIEVSRLVDASPGDAWTVLTDTRRWPEWGPSVSGVECVDREIEAGSTGTIETPLGIRLPFEVVTYEPYRWTWRVARIPATGHRVDPLDSGRSRVVFEVPPMAAPYVAVCEVALRRIERLVS